MAAVSRRVLMRAEEEKKNLPAYDREALRDNGIAVVIEAHFDLRNAKER